ncbi:ABC transporter permease [bacterium]|jgi:ABC-type transport system involved in multi-copper enzyme maturation permease subunit|nr:ABC transporter permease [bacterium]
MKPYLAIIRDSFHAAISSRVLWIAFVAIWLVLAALAPFGYEEDLTAEFRGARDLADRSLLRGVLAQGLKDPEMAETAVGRLAAAMPEEIAKELTEVSEGGKATLRTSTYADALNECLDDESWYDKEAWAPTLRLAELRELDELPDEQLDESKRRRRARLRIEAAMPGVFATRSAKSISLTYAGFEFPAELAVDKTRFVGIINQFVVPLIIDWLLGFILIFLGILVTASMIPDMLQPGSLHLLLSKPVSRSMLLISKFIGGCAFVFLCVIQLVVGLYLVAGLRLDIWNVRLLWCIPVSVFLFSVFYSVSVLAGMRWRSPILAIGVTTMFGGICFVVGIIGGVFDGFVTGPARIRTMAVAGDVTFASTQGSGLIRFDKATNEWVQIYGSDAISMDRLIPPVVVDEDTVVTSRTQAGRMNPFGSGASDLLVLSAENDWEPEPSLSLPPATVRIYKAGDSLLTLSGSNLNQTEIAGVLSAAGQVSNDESDEEATTDTPDLSGGLFSRLSSMLGVAPAGFTAVLPNGIAIDPPRVVVVGAGESELYVLSRARLLRFERSEVDQPWTQVAEHELEGDPSIKGVLAVAGGVLLVSRVEQPIELLDSETLEPIAQVPLSDRLLPTSVAGLGKGRFMLLTSDGRCRLVAPGNDGEKSYVLSGKVGPGSVEAITYHAEQNLVYVAHHTDQVDILNADDLSKQGGINPSLSVWRRVDKYFIGPLRFVIPQTGELGETIGSIVSGKSAIMVRDPSGEEQVVRYDILRPVFSCSLFVAIMMVINCTYFGTRDY